MLRRSKIILNPPPPPPEPDPAAEAAAAKGGKAPAGDKGKGAKGKGGKADAQEDAEIPEEVCMDPTRGDTALSSFLVYMCGSCPDRCGAGQLATAIF